MARMSPPVLRLAGIAKSFGGLRVLDGISFEVRCGEIVGLIGPNGAGKTTLFEIVSGFIRPNGGAIHFGGRDVTRLPPHRRARLGVARTFQIVQPFLDLTVLENVLVGIAAQGGGLAAAREQSAAVLERVKLARRADTPARHLTLPEKKRLELARALALRPRLLLLDEVMAGLTPVEVDQVMPILSDIRAGGTALLIVEHVMRAIMSLSDRVVALAGGRLIAEGEPAAVARDPAVIAAYLGTERHVVA
jgi:branched-chain amino acid transport system ATP-binding protein